MVEDDFTEEESVEELPEEFQDEPLPKKKGRPVTVAPTSQRRAAAPAPVAQTQQPMPVTPQQRADRFTPYISAKRAGVFDNESNKPMMEDAEVDNVLLGLLTIILNDLDDIKKRL